MTTCQFRFRYIYPPIKQAAIGKKKFTSIMSDRFVLLSLSRPLYFKKYSLSSNFAIPLLPLRVTRGAHIEIVKGDYLPLARFIEETMRQLGLD